MIAASSIAEIPASAPAADGSSTAPQSTAPQSTASQSIASPASPHADVAGRMNTLMHAMGRFRHHMQQAKRWGEGEAAYNMILFFLVGSGPARTGVLAEQLSADPSTISRQVAALVKDGLLERRADPEDGRATLLAPTELGLQRYRQQVARRDSHYGEMLADWDPAELADFARYLDRFTDDFENYKHQILADIATDPGLRPGQPAVAWTGREEN